jgi:hypothetical protein
MKKASMVSLFVFAALIAFISVAIAQTAEKGWEKTVTLPSGEVILDMSGEWAVSLEHYGPWAQYGVFPDIMEIKQEGTSFVGVTLLGSPRSPKGSEKLRGELDKNGFKKVQTITGAGPLDLNGEILSHGNRIILDDGKKIRLTLIRR